MSPRVRFRWRCALGAAALLAAGPAAAIVGGEAAGSGHARSAVMVLNSRGGVCSGVVLAPDVVLTAAHCVPRADQIRVHFRDVRGEPVLIEPAARASHPGYVADAVASRRRSIDLALLRLPSPLPDRFGPATLSLAPPAAGTPVTVAGFGVSSPGDPKSTGTLRSAALTAVEPHGRSRILLWASSPDGAGLCEGDSGGPLTNEAGEVVAISGWAAGARGRGCGGMSQGTLVGPQKSWVDAVLSGWGRVPAWR